MGRGMQGPVNLPHAQSCMQTVTICMRMWQAEAAARQEMQSKLAEQQREADKEKKALREQLEGKLRAARKEIAQLKSQVQTPCPTPIIHFCQMFACSICRSDCAHANQPAQKAWPRSWQACALMT